MRYRVKSLISLMFVFALLALPSLAFGALHLLVQATGSSQGPILGTSTLPGYENWIELTSFQHGVGIAAGPNGVPASAPSVSELTVSAGFDRSSVRLQQALSTNEPLTTFKMELVNDFLAEKMPMAVLRFDLVGAYVTSFYESGAEGSMPFVSYSLSYSKVTITDIVQGTSVTYFWTPPLTATPETLSKGMLLSPTPNPTHGQTQFSFTLPNDSNAQLTLFDLRGFRVRELYSGWTSSEPTVAVWDGTDDNGQRVAQGVYMARLTYPGHEVTQRLTVLR